MHRKTLFFALALIFMLTATSMALAQQQRLSGAVVDADDGSPLSGVAVLAEDTSAMTRTDAGGRFSLTVPAGHRIRLVFQRQGYRSATKIIDSSTSAIIISMKREG